MKSGGEISVVSTMSRKGGTESSGRGYFAKSVCFVYTLNTLL